MRHLITSILLITILVTATPPLLAAKPVLKRINPAGGQIGSKVVVHISGGSKSTKIWCSSPEIKITPDKKKGHFLFDIPKAVLPGHCWIRLYNDESASELKQFQLGMTPELLEVEPNNKLSQAQKIIQLPVTINGVLHKGRETDCYSVTLKKGQTVIASVTANESVGSPMDAVIQLVSSKGFVVEQNDDYHGFDPQIVFTAPADDSYSIRIFAFPSKPNQTINYSGSLDYIYRLLLTTGPFLDYPSPLNINIQPSASTSLIGWNIPNEMKQLPVRIIPKSNLALLSSPLLANSYRLETVKHPCLNEKIPDSNIPQSIMIPSSVTGVINKPGDMDSYHFLANKNQKIVFEIQSQKHGHPLDSVLKLKNDKGKVLIESDDVSPTKDSRINYTFKESGTYTIEVTDRFSHGGTRYVYLLTSKEFQPDFSIEVASHHFLIPKDKPLEIPVTIKRDLYKQVIKINCLGLPKEIEAKTVSSESKGGSSKSVKLILQNKGKNTWSGPIQIIANPENDSQLSRKASAPITNLKMRTQNLWLTALKPEPVPVKKKPKAK
jgi:Bacterial pre-peptidase C-terminal domain